MCKDVSFDYAVESASCHFGLTEGTSCLSAIWELPGEWHFVSAERADGTCALCKVDKRTGVITGLFASRLVGFKPPRLAREVEVPWKYLGTRKSR